LKDVVKDLFDATGTVAISKFEIFTVLGFSPLFSMNRVKSKAHHSLAPPGKLACWTCFQARTLSITCSDTKGSDQLTGLRLIHISDH
jgi:hypothetical protein